MVEQQTPFTPEQEAVLAERFARTKAAQQAETMRNAYHVPPAPAEPVAETPLSRRLVKTGEFKFASVVAAIVAGLDLAQSPEFIDAFGNVAMTDGSLDVGKIGAIVIASVVFAVRQYAKAAGERTG